MNRFCKGAVGQFYKIIFIAIKQMPHVRSLLLKKMQDIEGLKITTQEVDVSTLEPGLNIIGTIEVSKRVHLYCQCGNREH